MEPIREYDTFILGADKRCHVSTDCHKTQLNNNVLVVGGSGAGKTLGVMVPTILHMFYSNAVGIFTKWGMLSAIRRLLKKRGYTVHILNLSNPGKSDCGYDPLNYCETDEDIRDFAHAIIYSSPNSGQSKDPFWEQAAENLLYVVLWVVKRYAVPGKRTMETALRLLDRLVWNEDVPSSLEEYSFDERKRFAAHYILEKLSANDEAIQSLWHNYLKLPQMTGACVTNSMQTPLNAVFPNAVRACLYKDKQFDFNELTKSKTVLFVYVSPVNVSNHMYATLFYRQMFKNLFEIAEARPDKVLPYPVHVLCDDFATGGRIPDFDHYISIFREKGISSTLLIQSESQLAAIYGDVKAKTIINNCDTYVFLGGMDDETCASIAKKTDVPESEIRDMPVGAEYFVRRGQKAIRTQRYDVFSDPIYLNEIKGKEEEAEEVPQPAKESPSVTTKDLYELFGMKLRKKRRKKPASAEKQRGGFCLGVVSVGQRDDSNKNE